MAYLDDGSAINPDDSWWIDYGLGGFLSTRPEWSALATENKGKFKVPTLRNVDKRFRDGFTKAYSHNGYYKSLKSIVHFFNTRDAKPICATDFFVTAQLALMMDCWPAAEVPETVNTDKVGDLRLTDAEENVIVAFLKTLSDGYQTP